MKKLIYKIWSKFLIIFGELKIVKWFPWIQYDPIEYKMSADKIRRVLSLVKPGDVLLRRYDGYVDNVFIDGKYSHAGIYVGNDMIIHAVNPTVSEIDVIDFCRCDNICILRPTSGQTHAMSVARKYLADCVTYDFNYQPTDEAIYCFELCAKCYPNLDIKMFDVKYIFGLLRRTAYLGKSFIESPDFTIVEEF